MNRKRESHQIEAEILRICRDGAKKTWIVYKAYINFALVNVYIGELKRRGLLHDVEDLYQTTEEGLEFLREYESFNKIRFGAQETTKIITGER